MKENIIKGDPLVSIIIPVYNGSDFLKDAINSAMNQTYKNIEILVINDGSTDNTEEIVRTYGTQVRYLKKENGGVSTALNLGISKANGKYISWLSHDDMYFPDKIHIQVETLRHLPKGRLTKTILYSNYELINQDGGFISRTYYHFFHKKEKLNNSLYPLFTGLVNGCTLLIPKTCFKECGTFDKKYPATQDYHLWFKMFPHYSLRFLPQTLVYSRRHEKQGSVLSSTSKECSELWIHMLEHTSERDKKIIASTVEEFYLQTFSVVTDAKYVKAAAYIKEKYEMLFNRTISKNYLPQYKKEQKKLFNMLRMKLLNRRLL